MEQGWLHPLFDAISLLMSCHICAFGSCLCGITHVRWPRSSYFNAFWKEIFYTFSVRLPAKRITMCSLRVHHKTQWNRCTIYKCARTSYSKWCALNLIIFSSISDAFIFTFFDRSYFACGIREDWDGLVIFGKTSQFFDFMWLLKSQQFKISIFLFSLFFCYCCTAHFQLFRGM